MTVRAGSYVWIKVPQVSKTQWHPYTLTSSPRYQIYMFIFSYVSLLFFFSDRTLELHIRDAGDFSHKLLKWVESVQSQATKNFPSSNEKLRSDSRHDHNDNDDNDVPDKLPIIDDSLDNTYIEAGTLLPPLPFRQSIYVDGAYGSAADDVFDFRHAMLIGAGIGGTPFISILKEV